MEPLSKQLHETGNELIRLLGSLSQAQTDQIPFAGSWTAGELAEHVCKAAAGLTGVLHGTVTAAQRPMDEKVAVLRDVFLDYSTKMKSPDFVLPTERTHPREALLASLESAFTAVASAAGTLDLSLLCTDRELPRLGTLTRFEWCSFLQLHTQRHIHQLQGIIHALGLPVPVLA